jgi:ABC-type glycerol-3-phosphate transport system substrate-binding protein
MIRITRLAVPAAALLLAACGGDNHQQSAAPADSADMVKATSAIPGALGGAPARAQEGVDSANVAASQREADVDALSDQASGVTSAPPTTATP